MIMSDRLNPMLESNGLLKQSRRNSKWYEEATNNLKKNLIPVFHILTSCNNSKIHLEQLKFCQFVIENCSQTLCGLEEICLEQIIVHLKNDSEEVRKECQQLVDKVFNSVEVMDKVETGFEKFIETYEKVMQTNLGKPK